jgi:hypothetical protein
MHYAIPCGPNRELYGRPIESALAGEGRTSALAPCGFWLLTNETNRCLSFLPCGYCGSTEPTVHLSDTVLPRTPTGNTLYRRVQ